MAFYGRGVPVAPLTEGILASLIANGLTAIISHLVSDKGETLRRERLLIDALQKDAPLSAILQKAVVSVAKATHFHDQRQTEKLRFFLVSPDAEAIIRQIYGTFLANTTNQSSLPIIQAEFLSSLSLHLGQDPGTLKEVSDSLFDALLRGCERALDRSIDRGILSAHEAKSAARHRMILDQFAGVQKNLELLRLPHKLSIEEILSFEAKYRLQLVDRHGFITPPHFDMARKLPIKEICVSPQLFQLPQSRDKEPVLLTFEQFLSGLYRAVVLGNPGGGKSTLAGKICYDLAVEYRMRLLGRREVTPILVILRDYGAAKKEHHCSIVQFMERVANSNYQISPPPGSFEYMLSNGRAMVMTCPQ